MLPNDYEFVHILCYTDSLESVDRKVSKDYNKLDPDLIHNQIIPLIPPINKTSQSTVPNVLLLAIDSTSYLNFKRHFIRTEKLLRKHKFFELRGYNKVGANTYPNMIPFLTGHVSKELVPDSELKRIYFDNWPLIWKQYSNEGFVTLFLEEMSWCGLFTFNLKGFKSKPTDYQTRPFHMEIGKSKSNYYCYNSKTETEHSLDYTYDFVRAMNERKQKYFAYISISEMTHDWISGGHYMDVPYYQLLSKLFNKKLLNNTLILFFSDHGFRYGKLRQTHTGEIENRLPFMFIHLPENTNKKYVENLSKNQHRLTTHFDIHATLTHLINGEANHSLPHGLSLFEEISDSRDCNSASIPDMYCSCYEDIEIEPKDFDSIKPIQIIAAIIEKLNSFTDNVRTKCAELEFESIHKIYNRTHSRTDSQYGLGDSMFYIIQLYVNPGMALFETIVRSYGKNTRFEIIGEITRINRYGKQSHCIKDKILNNYCFCKDLIK